MAEHRYIDVNLFVYDDSIPNRSVKMEIGCSFENNTSIYRVNKDGKLSVFDKSTKKWAAGDGIKMDKFQFGVFKAVANNKFEKTDGEIKDIILSKEDIDIAKNMSLSQLNKDLKQFCDTTKNAQYHLTNSALYENNICFSTNQADKNNNIKSRLIFKYGSAKDAVKLSERVESKENLTSKGKPVIKDSTKVSKASTKIKTNSAQQLDKKEKDYVSVDIILDKKNNIVKHVKIEKGCSFENNSALYRVDESGKLMVYNKSTKKWTAGNSIEMRNYQYDTFRAVANNKFEKTNGEIKDIILSKEDIDLAKKMYEKNELHGDLQQFLRVDSDAKYEALNIKTNKNMKGFSTYVTNGNKKTSGLLVFNYGTQNEAIKLSNEKQKNRKTLEKAEKTPIKPSLASEVANIFTRKNSKNKEGLIIPGLGKKYRPYITNIAKRNGYSETLLSLIISHEKYTPVAVWKNEGGRGGLNEVGFGHTTRANHNNKFKKGFELPLEKAFQWFETDVQDKEAKIREFGNKYYNYDNLPQSMKEILIDVAFNRGEAFLDPRCKKFDKNYKKVIEFIKNGDYASAAVHLRQAEYKMASVNRNGLRKRNVNRFLSGIRDLPAKERLNAMDLFNKNGYYTRTVQNLNKADANIIKKNWNNVYNKAKAEVKPKKRK